MLNNIAWLKRICLFVFLSNFIILDMVYAEQSLQINQQISQGDELREESEMLNLELDDEDLAFLAEHMNELEELNDVELSIQDKIELGLVLLSIKRDQYVQHLKEHVAYYKMRYLVALTLSSIVLGGVVGYHLCKLKQQRAHGQ